MIVPCWPLGTGRAARRRDLRDRDVDLRVPIARLREHRPRDRRLRRHRHVERGQQIELPERCLPPDRLVDDRQPIGARRRAVVLREDREAALNAVERTRVAQRADDQPLRDARRVDVLIAHARLAGHARRQRLRRIEAAHRRPGERRVGRRVVRPVAVGRRTHVAVVGPDRVEDRAGRRAPC